MITFDEGTDEKDSEAKEAGKESTNAEYKTADAHREAGNDHEQAAE